ncbi:uncharacterized protein [Diadema antillarum]|uniref:uncharacterized protein n=1 Tax=Diadema antillarum TaxID=105358 RepID=UPI003A85E3AF
MTDVVTIATTDSWFPAASRGSDPEHSSLKELSSVMIAMIDKAIFLISHDAPPYELHDSNPSQVTPGNNPLQPAAPPPANAALPSESIPNLPAVPMSSFPPLDNTVGGKSAGGEDVDFDDLTRRFEELKKKK